MAKQVINVSTPNDGLGDTLRDSQIKANSNFTELYDNKVDKIAGKGLSTNDYTTAEKIKLSDIEENAQLNVQADWNQTDDTFDDFIKNKPTDYVNAFGTLHYSDLTTQTVPLVVLPSVAKKLTNDTLGDYTIISNAPYGVGTIWNSTTNRFNFSTLSVGDAILLRVDAQLTTTTANQTSKVYLKLGIGSASEFDLILAQANIKTSGAYPFISEVSFDLAYSDIANYPAELYIFSDDDATVKINGWYLEITRKSINLIDVVENQDNIHRKFEMTLSDIGASGWDDVDLVEKLAQYLSDLYVIVGETEIYRFKITDVDGNYQIYEQINVGKGLITNDPAKLALLVDKSIPGGGGSQDLQSVTDIGNVTTNQININNINGLIVDNTNGFTQINGGAINLTDSLGSTVEITSSNVAAGYEAQFPDKTGIQTIAMLSDVGGGDFIPLSGTEVGSPITGDLEFEDEVILFNENITEDTLSSIGFQEGGAILTTENKTTNFSTAIRTSPTNAYIDSNDPDSKGLIGSTDFSANYTDNTYVQKKWVVDNFGGAGDMLLNAIQTVTALKTFLSGTFGLRNVANTFTSFFTNANTASRTYTLQDRNGTLADDTDLALKAPLASPTFTGTPTAPTASAGTNNTQIATTAYVDTGLFLKENLPIQETIATTGTTNLDFSFDSFDKITQTGSIVIGGINTSGTKLIEKTFLIQGSTNPAHTITFDDSWENLSGVNADSTKMNFVEVNLINGSIVYSINKYDIPDVTAPTLLKSSILLESLNTIELLYSEPIDSSVTTLTSWYSITGKTVTAVTILSNKVRVVVSVPFAESDNPLVTFTNQVVGNGIQDASGNKAANFSQNIGLTTYRTDNFNRANSTTSVNSPSDAGSDWITPFGAVWGINTNKAYCFGANTTTAQANVIYLESGESNVTLRAKFTFGTSGATSSTQFITRYIDANNHYICQIGKLFSGQLFYSVTKIVAGVATSLVSNTNFGTWVNGTEYTFMIKFSGNTLTLYNGTTSLVQVVDSSITGTKHGLRVFSGSGSSGNTDRFDDFGVYYG